MVAPVNVRLPEATHEALGRFVRATGRTRSSVVSTAVDEWLRLQKHPRVRFVTDETGGRRAALIDGPQVWTVAQAWLDQDAAGRDAAVVADATGLPVTAVEAGLAYWADHRDEIDEILERHRLAQDEALAAWERRQALLSA